jgi:hypothetical protein
MYLHCYGAKYVYLLQNYIAMDKLAFIVRRQNKRQNDKGIFAA